MQNIEKTFEAVSLAPEAKRQISQLLKNTEPAIVQSWLDGLTIKDRKIAGTYYADLGAKLPYSDFVALYKAIGYDFARLEAWQDWKCYDGGCQRKDGFSCDPSSCK